MELENKHIVLKTKDIHNALSTDQLEQLKIICETITTYRKRVSKGNEKVPLELRN